MLSVDKMEDITISLWRSQPYCKALNINLFAVQKFINSMNFLEGQMSDDLYPVKEHNSDFKTVNN